MLPLDGTTVLDLTRILAGPFATMKLGDMGARVWKVERPGAGDDTRGWGPPFIRGESAYFLAVNRSKESIAIDLKSAGGQEVLGRLVRAADVLVENFRPGTLEELGFSWERLQELNPRLVYCSISGYGHEGARRELPSYDVIVQGEAGVQDVTGFPDGPPVKVGVSLADLYAGELAVEGILLSLLARARTGRGDRVDVALFDGLLALLTYQGQGYLGGGPPPRRLGNAHPSIVPYQAFETADGFVNVGVGSESLFRAFAQVVGLPDLPRDARFASNAARVGNRSALLEMLQPIFRSRTCAEWCRLLGAASVPVGVINPVPAALGLAEADGRGMIVTVDHPVAGPLRMVGNPVRLGATVEADRAGRRFDPPPRLGQHTDEVLKHAGYGADEVKTLRAAGVVA